MRSKTIAALIAGCGAAALLFATIPAEAAKKRPPTRVTVIKYRSYLNPGTEVLPLSRQYTDYAIPPLWAPSRIYDPAGSTRTPLPETWYLPGYTRGY